MFSITSNRIFRIMARRQREWAAKVRDQLFDALGRVCTHCGSIKELEFDVITPIDSGHPNTHTKREWSWRMSFYRREHFKRNVQVLCRVCNSKKQNQLELTFSTPYDATSSDPF